jgi:hypothetical protein
MIISRSVLPRMRNVSEKSCRENQNVPVRIMFNNFFLNLAFYELMLTHAAEQDRKQMTTWYMRIACWITMSTNTHSEYVTHIAFLLQR